MPVGIISKAAMTLEGSAIPQQTFGAMRVNHCEQCLEPLESGFGDARKRSWPESAAPPAASAKRPRKNASGSSKVRYKGVRMRSWGRWVSEIREPNTRTRIWLGSFPTAEMAAKAYDAAVFCLLGDTGTLNFPEAVPADIPRCTSPRDVRAAAYAAAVSSGTTKTSQARKASKPETTRAGCELMIRPSPVVTHPEPTRPASSGPATNLGPGMTAARLQVLQPFSSYDEIATLESSSCCSEPQSMLEPYDPKPSAVEDWINAEFEDWEPLDETRDRFPEVILSSANMMSDSYKMELPEFMFAANMTEFPEFMLPVDSPPESIDDFLDDGSLWYT